jgi:cellulose biosynthesis protein BcsQ
VELSPPFVTMLVAIGTAAVSVLWWAIRTYLRNRELRIDLKKRDKRITLLQDEIKRIESQNGQQADTVALRKRIVALKKELNRLQEEKQRIIAKGDELVEVYKDLQRRWKSDRERLARAHLLARQEIEHFQASNEEFSRQIQELESQIDGMKTQDGRLWHRAVAPTATAFRPMSQRGFPIISVLNFKGGVGKTTITAHLAGALGQQGKRVLMIDLDYQRSLSMMLVPDAQLTILSLGKRCIQHFLAADANDAHRLLSCVHGLGDSMSNCSIITNSDYRNSSEANASLEETEARLMAEWTVEREGTDIRLLLREALHSPDCTSKFDCVLLDCPPRLTTACINALAASDFVLIPVILDAMSAKSVPELLRSLKEMRQGVLSHLDVLGVVANMTTIRNGDLVAQEKEIWTGDLRYGIRETWVSPVHFFAATVPQKSQFSKASGSLADGKLQLALADASIQECFKRLVREIEKEMRNHERSHASAVSS